MAASNLVGNRIVGALPPADKDHNRARAGRTTGLTSIRLSARSLGDPATELVPTPQPSGTGRNAFT